MPAAQVFDLRDLTAKSLPCRKKELRVGVQDVAFGDDDAHVAVLVRRGVAAHGSRAIHAVPGCCLSTRTWQSCLHYMLAFACGGPVCQLTGSART